MESIFPLTVCVLGSAFVVNLCIVWKLSNTLFKKKKKKKASLQLSSERNSPLSLHFTQIKSQEWRGSQMVCHNLGWSIHPPQNCGLEPFSLWSLHSLHFYFLHVLSQMPANLRGLDWPAIFFLFRSIYFHVPPPSTLLLHFSCLSFMRI